MARVLVAIISRDRPNLLKLTSKYMFGMTDVWIYDDDSTHPEVLDYLEGTCCEVVHFTGNRGIECRTYQDRAMRCARIRAKIFDDFLEKDEFDYLLLKDDDVLIPSASFREAVDDFEFFRNTDYMCDVGALTLHGLQTHLGNIMDVRGGVFRDLEITGEANVLFSREAALVTGNHFAAVKGGFADTQFSALRQGGFRYVDRVWPPYQIQHLGFGPQGSIIHGAERSPSWNQGPYTCTYHRMNRGKPVQVPDFDLSTFHQNAATLGGEAAAGVYSRKGKPI